MKRRKNLHRLELPVVVLLTVIDLHCWRPAVSETSPARRARSTRICGSYARAPVVRTSSAVRSSADSLSFRAFAPSSASHTRGAASCARTRYEKGTEPGPIRTGNVNQGGNVSDYRLLARSPSLMTIGRSTRIGLATIAASSCCGSVTRHGLVRAVCALTQAAGRGFRARLVGSSETRTRVPVALANRSRVERLGLAAPLSRRATVDCEVPIRWASSV